ncbi:MAG: WD40/YVTN/BNR-like repeat-containing protein [Gemmatimonadaceae bacterium]
MMPPAFLQIARHGAQAALLSSGLAAGLQAQARVAPLEMREADPRLRREWFTSMRAYPERDMPADKVAAMREMRAGLRYGTFARATFAEQWQPIGPVGFISMNTPYSSSPMTDEGRFTSIAINPRDPRNIIAGSGSAGVWRTVNGGASWQALTDNECSTSIGAVAMDPVDPRIVYVGTGEIFDPTGRTDGCGILRSTNGGDTWTRVGTQFLAPPGQLGALV